MPGPQVYKGVRFLKRYLLENHFVWHQLDLPAFRSWLSRQITYKRNDPVFQQRCKIRDIKRTHYKRLQELHTALQTARKDFERCTQRKRLEKLPNLILGRAKAVAGLRAALAQSSGIQLEQRRAKLAAYQEELQNLQTEQAQLIASTPEYQVLRSRQQALDNFEEAIGLTKAQQQLQQLLQQQGHRRGAAGDKFEHHSQTILQQHVIPLVRHYPEKRPGKIIILSQVTLGCARAEFDYLVVQQHETQTPVLVLGVVEVKRNINDIALGFSHRQENLAWFTGQRGQYDPQLYRTNVFRQGEFDRPVWHCQQGKQFLFSPDSFALFVPNKDCGYFMERLFFITVKRPLQGMSSSEHARILYRSSTDVHFDLQNQEYLKVLFEQLRELVSPFQTRDVITLYASQVNWGQQFLMLAHT